MLALHEILVWISKLTMNKLINIISAILQECVQIFSHFM